MALFAHRVSLYQALKDNYKLSQSTMHRVLRSNSAPLLKLSSRRLSSKNNTSQSSDHFLSGTSAAYIDQMYDTWKRDPTAVHASWQSYFRNIERGVSPKDAFSLPPSLSSETPVHISRVSSNESYISSHGSMGSLPYVPGAIGSLPSGASFITPDMFVSTPAQSVHDTGRLIQMVRGYQMRGHELAKNNPLDLPSEVPFCSTARAKRRFTLDYTSYGFTESDLDRVFDCRVPGMCGFLSPDQPPRTLRQIVSRLEEAYCGTVGVEYMHMSDQNTCNFIRQWVETPYAYSFSPEMKRKILARTARSQLFENFCAQRFSTSKRFGLDGCETMIVGMKAITKKAAREGINSLIIGMPHRGRLNVLVNVMHKPMQEMLSEFQGISRYNLQEWGNTGDVKYHLGVEFDHFDKDSQRYLHMAVLANPSHLEAVNPLVVGQARAQQYYSGDVERNKVLPIILHGDASVAGQGVVYETLQMSQLPHYAVGGTVHIVVNNQIGFTTNPVDAGSGKYCTDIAKAIDVPVFHVSADDPEAVTFACELALEYRQRFASDVFIDLIGYRRYGHNELDMPKFTQPLVYNIVSKKLPAMEIYANRLLEEGVVTPEDITNLKENISEFYLKELEKSKTYLPKEMYEYAPQWKHLVTPGTPAPPRLTGVALDILKDLGRKLFTLPSTFTGHPTIVKIFKQRLECLESPHDKLVDFGTAELLAYSSLLSDGFHIRFAGQDVQRGTFSHRHAVLHDQTLNTPYNIFDSLAAERFPHKIEFANSPLSEYAAMGFELGYSLEHPDSLCVWEAQFGDFHNGAQIIVDQFISSGEIKWNKQNGLVLMLPHGYDGQGPEHSSGRIERFLQLCDDREDVIHEENWDLGRVSVIQQHNMQVVMPSTPASTFHILRRQMHREFRKPLIIFSPKRMLKMRTAMCSMNEISEGTRFKRYIEDQDTKDPTLVERLILCSGQVYYNLHSERERLNSFNENILSRVAIARVEQLSPFPFDMLIKDLQRYKNIRSIVWAQEEPMNQGSWLYTSKRIESSLAHLNYPNGIRLPIYVGRDVSGSTAVGDKKLHDQELAQLLNDAFNLNMTRNSYYEKYSNPQMKSK